MLYLFRNISWLSFTQSLMNVCFLIWRVVIYMHFVTHPCHIPPLTQARPMMLCIYTSKYNIEVSLCTAIEACDIKWNTAYLENEVLVHQTWMLWLRPYTAKCFLVANELVRSLNCYNTISCSHSKGYSHVSNFVQLTEEFMNSYSRLLL